jgi:5'-nucleotidase/UDP-sugar diphosphatase
MKIRSIAAILLAATTMVAPAFADKVNITFLLTNDIYNFDANKDGRGGFARLNAVVKAERAKGGNVIYANAGDMISPAILSGIDKGENTIKLSNIAPPDIFVPGNHEFDFGPAIFKDRMKELKTTVLAANLHTADDKSPEGIADSKIIEIGGLKVGIFGIAADETPIVSSPGPDYKFAEAVPAAAAAAAALRKQGAEFIVGVVHADKSQNDAMIANHSVDLLLSGHEHNLYASYDGKTAFAESMTEAIYITAVDISLNVETKDGKHEISWFPNFRIIDSATVIPDPETQMLVDQFNGMLSKELSNVVGTTTTALDSRKATVRGKESEIGDLIADAIRDAMKADIAITNGGGIRGNKEYAAGTKLTRKDILTELPFGNKTVKLEVKGDAVLAAIENGLSDVANGAGRFPQVSGIVVEADLTKPAGSRVTSIMVGGKPLDKAATYTVATNDYMANGGDGYITLKASKILVNAQEGKLMASDVITYVEGKKEVAPAVEGRMKIKM